MNAHAPLTNPALYDFWEQVFLGQVDTAVLHGGRSSSKTRDTACQLVRLIDHVPVKMRFQVGAGSRLTKWLPGKSALAVLRCATAAGGGVAWGTEDPACAPIRTVQNKLNATKRIQLSVQWVDDGFGYTGVSESRVLEWKVYKRWEKEPWQVESREPERVTIGGIPTVSNCKHAGDDVLDGVATTVFTYDRFRPQGKWRVRMWISKKTGLPVRTHFKAFESNNSQEMITTFGWDPTIGEPEFGTKP